MKPKPRRRDPKIAVRDVLIVIGIGAALIVGLFFIFIHHSQTTESAVLSQTGTSSDLSSEQGTASTPPFTQMNLNAKAVYIFDTNNNQVLYAVNQNQVLPLASLTKLMTALVASEVLSPQSTVEITGKALDEDGDNGLNLDELWTTKNLLDFTLIVSSNDGAEALAEAGTAAEENQMAGAGAAQVAQSDDDSTFIASMNTKAKSLGLSSMHFDNPTGLDISTTEPGAEGSAKDTAQLMEDILKTDPTLLEATRYPVMSVSSLSAIHSAENTDTIIDTTPGLIASKTGYSDLAGGNLAVAFDIGPDHPIIAVVLGSGYDTRFSDMQEVVKATYAHFAETP